MIQDKQKALTTLLMLAKDHRSFFESLNPKCQVCQNIFSSQEWIILIESLAEERNQRIMESQKIVEKIKLKPCPFCGGTAQFKNPVNKGLYSELSVECRRCGASPYVLEMYGNKSGEEKKKALAEVWNRRT